MDPGAEQFARLRRFAALVAGDPDGVPLDRAPLTMAAVLYSRPVDAAMATLDELAAGCPTATFDGLRQYLFDDLGFGGDGGAGDHPVNSLLDVVLRRRCGLPITLATVMIEVGRRVGVPIVGIGMPMHFLVRRADDADAFVDPSTGAALDPDSVRASFEAMAAGRLSWNPGYLAPTAPRLVVVRMLTNLRASYRRREDRVHLALVARMRASIPELHEEAAEAVRLGAVFN